MELGNARVSSESSRPARLASEQCWLSSSLYFCRLFLSQFWVWPASRKILASPHHTSKGAGSGTINDRRGHLFHHTTNSNRAVQVQAKTNQLTALACMHRQSKDTSRGSYTHASLCVCVLIYLLEPTHTCCAHLVRAGRSPTIHSSLRALDRRAMDPLASHPYPPAQRLQASGAEDAEDAPPLVTRSLARCCLARNMSRWSFGWLGVKALP